MNKITISFEVNKHSCYNSKTKQMCMFFETHRLGTKFFCSIFKEEVWYDQDTLSSIRLEKCREKFSEEVEDV